MSTTHVRWIPLIVLPLSACVFVVRDGEWEGPFGPHALRGSGACAEQVRSVPEFHAIVLQSPADVVVEVGGPTEVRLVGDDNLLSKVRTTVEDGVLVIDLERRCAFTRGLELAIRTPGLDGCTIEGSGDVTIRGLAAEDLVLAIEGSGSLHAQGSARALEASIEGSGDLELGELAADVAHVSIEGSGEMEVRVAHTLHYSIEGSGSIRYAGDAKLVGDIDGSGEVVQRR
jgi:hypothetical protein